MCASVRDKRREIDRSFAATLVKTGGEGAELTVESLLERVVAPVVTSRRRPVLLLLLDGMSAAVTASLGEQLRQARWEEYDPIEAGEPRRRAVAAAFPTLTRVSRSSLLSARLTTGGAEAERRAFEGHGFWRTPVRLFHRSGIPGGAGEALSEELSEALDDDRTTVGVVLNAIDDDLDKGRADTTWRIQNIAGLKELIDYARLQGRALIITSDHGHVLERGSTHRDTPDSASARHRSGSLPPETGEIEITGPRVVAENRRIVALWDSGLRYGPKKAGYHGGAALAEVTIPLLAFLPFGADPPKGWRALPVQEPPWWSSEEPLIHPQATRLAPALFDLPRQSPPVTLTERLLKSKLFEIQHRSTARRADLEKIRTALSALETANWHLPLSALAQRLGYTPTRAAAFATTLSQILNIDNYPVLQLLDNTRSLKINITLLEEQFNLENH